ncbi:ABC-2 family transporter protein [Candidatus Nomurabacteria bacterium]|uniref:ABC-2 family transporter protein n=1 Tax=Candidatus Dojkabacteria bacterium TaxID=2099670 RepID=A0A955KWF1_9BACT|nr:ABC-2 family transporter protein [Candidatus Dojkabacteria bacterium]MCB9790193.1 ABC-2 family transporter protein [Candidatus Nomurabacteria bacterium]MCB9803287.1 ABC-2 family transporter protein [Candidatus Nomurabacteria bacterium]
MQKYLANLKLGFYRYRQYPMEFLFTLIKRLLQIFFIVVFWEIIGSETGDKPLIELVIYFILFNATADLIMAQTFSLGDKIARMIHTGELNNVLIKPVNPQLYIYSKNIGTLMPLIFVSTTALGILIAIGQLKLVHIPFFLVYLLIAIGIGIGLNSILASFAFYFTKIFGLREIFKYTTRIFSGSFIPIYFMPDILVTILDYSFLSYVGYKPVLMMLGMLTPTVKDLSIGIFWVILITLTSRLFWSKSIGKYEAYGI